MTTLIKNLVFQKYNLFNVSSNKQPVDILGNGLTGWESKTYDELIQNHNYDKKLWGLRLGEQENGKYIISLDFDCCGKKDKEGKRIGCKYTKEKFEEYRKLKDKDDGLYSSSTEGNYNVLIDVTQCDKILEKIKILNVTGFSVKSLEIFIKNTNQVIPPSKTISKISGKAEKSRDFFNDEPFYIMTESSSIYNYVIKLFDDKINGIKTVKIKKSIKEEVEEVEEHKKKCYTQDKHLDLLFNVIGNDRDKEGVKIIDAVDWFAIAGVLKHNGFEKEIWLDYSGKISKTMTASRKWDSISTTNNTIMSLGTLYNIAKKYNNEGYLSWKKKNKNYFITLNDIQDPYKVCEIITEDLSEKLKLCKESWYMLVGNFWEQQKTPDLYVIRELRKYIDITQEINAVRIKKCDDEEEKEKLVAYQKEFLESYKFTLKPAYLNVLIKFLKGTLVDNNFDEKLDVNIGKLAFKNGIMDLKTKKFREGILWSDYLTTTINYDYKESNTDYVKSVLKKILNNNDEHLNYFLSLIGYSLTGDASNQKALYFMIDKLNGKGDNGKSFFFELLSELMPNYVYNTSGAFLELKNTKSHKQLAMMKGKRLVWIDEQTKNKLKTELVKQVSNGKKIENEIMFGTSENINILFKLFIISNHVPNIDPSEDAVYNRYKQISFSSHFDRTGERKVENAENLEFIADISLADKILNKYYNEIFQIVIDFGHQFYISGLVEEPLEFKEDKQETKEHNNPFIEWFKDNIIKDESEKLYIDDIVEKYNKPRDIVRTSMERLGLKYDKDLSFGIDKISKKKKRGGFKGVRFLNENELGVEINEIKTISMF
jgi:hypothetical protein